MFAGTCCPKLRVQACCLYFAESTCHMPSPLGMTTSRITSSSQSCTDLRLELTPECTCVSVRVRALGRCICSPPCCLPASGGSTFSCGMCNALTQYGNQATSEPGHCWHRPLGGLRQPFSSASKGEPCCRLRCKYAIQQPLGVIHTTID